MSSRTIAAVTWLVALAMVGGVEAAPPKKVGAWQVAYERTCGSAENDGIVLPVIADDRSAFVSCGALFAFDTGQYLGPARVKAQGTDTAIGLMPMGRATMVVAQTYNHAGSGSINKLARSPDGKLVLAYRGDSRTVALLDVPALARRDVATLERTYPDSDIGFLADGTPLVLSEQRCQEVPIRCLERPGSCAPTGRRCERIISRVELGALVPLANAPGPLTSFVVARSGKRALITRSDGTRAVVELPSWRKVVELPAFERMPHRFEAWSYEDGKNPAAGPSYYYGRASIAALSDDGRRVAFIIGTAEQQLVIAEITNRRLVELDRRPARRAKALSFSSDGRSLVVTGFRDEVIVVREGARPAPQPTVRYAPALPGGFRTVQATNEHGDGLWSSVPGIPLAQFQFSEEHLPDFKLVLASTLDAAELGPPTMPLASWKTRVLQRIEPDGVDHEVSWTKSTGRVVEYARFIRECLDLDIVGHVEERGGIIYRVEIHVPATTPRKELDRYLETFIDQPLGAPLRPRALPPSPPQNKGGC